MILRLKITQGSRKKDEFTIKNEVFIGRSRSDTDLTIDDHKASAKHARIHLADNHTFQLEDLASSNGTSLNGHKINEQKELKLGDTFTIGRTSFEVIEISGESLFEKGSWQATVDASLSSAQSLYDKLPPAQSDFGFFKEPVSLEVTKGDAKGGKFTFTFGPRLVGKYSVDAPVFAKDFPDEAFELRPLKGQCELFTKIKDAVKVNSNSVHAVVLKDGDLISVGQTEILVKFLSDI